jgi:hypothetical protein
MEATSNSSLDRLPSLVHDVLSLPDVHDVLSHVNSCLCFARFK